MRTIWKYDLAVTDVQKVSMPAGAILLHVGLQRENQGYDRTVTLWASVNSLAPKVERMFAVVGTGNPAPEPGADDAVYVGSVMDGPFVWHVFDGGEL